jgi:hypothetical protein
MFSFLYHILNLQRLSIYTWLKYTVTGNIDFELVSRCKNEIIQSGFVTIKLCQWSLPRLNLLYDLEREEWFKELEKIYDSCYIHDKNYTKEIYNLTTGKNFDDEYILKEVIASGSIGQVYRIKDKKTGEIKALKCKHPGTNFQYRLSICIIRSISFFMTAIKRIHYRIFPVDLETFFESLYAQVYLTNEANNLVKMYDNFKDTDRIVIPKLYDYNDDMIIMEYIEGIKYDNLDISQNQRYKICFLLYLTLRQMVLIDNTLHGDLHKGNWKVIADHSSKTMKYKIVLYDMGYCFKVQHGLEILESIEQNNVDKLSEIMPYTSTDVYNRPINERKHIIKNELQGELIRPVANKNIINNILGVSKKHGFILNGHFLSIGIIIEQTSSIFDEFLINKDAELKNEKITDVDRIYKDIIIKKDYPDIIAFCQTYKCFPKLITYYENLVNEQENDRTGIFEGCDFSDLIDVSTAIMED